MSMKNEKQIAALKIIVGVFAVMGFVYLIMGIFAYFIGIVELKGLAVLIAMSGATLAYARFRWSSGKKRILQQSQN